MTWNVSCTMSTSITQFKEKEVSSIIPFLMHLTQVFKNKWVNSPRFNLNICYYWNVSIQGKMEFTAFTAFPLLTFSFLLVLYFMQLTGLLIKSAAGILTQLFFFVFECTSVPEATVDLDMCKVYDRNSFPSSSQLTLNLIIREIIVTELLFCFQTHGLTNTFFSLKQHIENQIKYVNFCTVVFQHKIFLREQENSCTNELKKNCFRKVIFSNNLITYNLIAQKNY